MSQQRRLISSESFQRLPGWRKLQLLSLFLALLGPPFLDFQHSKNWNRKRKDVALAVQVHGALLEYMSQGTSSRTSHILLRFPLAGKERAFFH
ncbi:hypothetical protein D9M72_426500 [compost metagenome]